MALFDWLGGPQKSPYLQGVAAFDDRDFALSADCFEQCLESEPDPNKRRLARFYYSESLFNLSRQALKGENWAATTAWYLKAVEKHPNYPDLRLVLAFALAKAGDTAGAKEHFEAAASINPRFARAKLAHGWFLITQGDNEAAMEMVRTACGLDESFLGPDTTEAFNAADAGDWDDAARLIERVFVEAEPPNLHAIQTANKLYHIGDFQSASFEYEKALVATPGYADLWCRLGECRIKLGKPTEAIEALICALSINHKYADAHFHLALAQKLGGRNEDAKATLSKLLEIEATYPGAQELLHEMAA